MPALERKRPWYLVLALLGCLMFGGCGVTSGWAVVTYYREPINLSFADASIVNEANRESVVKLAHAYVNTREAARSRAYPLGIASLLLGAAMIVFAMRALGGSGGARALLVQLVVAQAGANAASYWLTRDVVEAGIRLNEAQLATDMPQRSRADDVVRALMTIGTLGSALLVVALTRRRSREFFDASGAQVEGR